MKRLYDPLCLLAIAALFVLVATVIAPASEACPTLREIREAYPHSHPSWHYDDDGHRCWYVRGHPRKERQHIDKVKVYGWDEYNEIDAAADLSKPFEPWQRAEPVFNH